MSAPLPDVALCYRECDFFTWSPTASSCPFCFQPGVQGFMRAEESSEAWQWVTGTQGCRSLWGGVSEQCQNWWGSSLRPWPAAPAAAWAEQGLVGRESLLVCTAPKLVVFEAVIYPNKEKQWFSDHLRFLSCVHWLAGWLTWYLNWKHKGIPLKWRALVRLMDILESWLGRWYFPHL